jgi:hypothetical protein
MFHEWYFRPKFLILQVVRLRHPYAYLTAASLGFKIIYVPRLAEDSREVRERVRVVRTAVRHLGFEISQELAKLICEARPSRSLRFISSW